MIKTHSKYLQKSLIYIFTYLFLLSLFPDLRFCQGHGTLYFQFKEYSVTALLLWKHDFRPGQAINSVRLSHPLSG